MPAPTVQLRRHSSQSRWRYADLDRSQRKLAETVRAGALGALLVSELAPVITLGRRTAASDLLAPRELLASQGIEVYPTDRGGLATYHGPGQWVLFAVDRLDRLTGDPRGVRRAVERLLQIALEVGRLYDPAAEVRDGCEQGVWTRDGKFAAVGIHVAGGVLLHGLSVNGFRTPTSFQGLRPCGLDLPISYLLETQSQIGVGPLEGSQKELEFQRLGDRLIRQALKTLWNAESRESFFKAASGTVLTKPDVEAIPAPHRSNIPPWGPSKGI